MWISEQNSANVNSFIQLVKGTVLNIYSTENLDGGETFAEVQFDSGEKGVFTLDKGELKFVKSSSNGFYFPDHLPLLMHRVKDTSLPSRDGKEEHN
ncbi:unnamed protein product [Allacma fusca]|uniref:Uncharacterized protein n=1 Tax=Allacma fusca TaxID=39272 RepID=A0A8J2KCG7_9HEXA|nr:unnamed protein product [Allacma fusca]